MNGYNDYSQPLIVPQDFMNYLSLSKHIFPQQWAFLSAVRGITLRDSDDLIEYKERQIFMIMLNLQCIANYKLLKHWAMIISIAFYGWGTKDMVGNVTSFLGITVSRTTRDEFFKELTADRVRMFQRLLASNGTRIMVWDNFQRGQELRDQRGDRSSKFLIGTVEAVHPVIPFHTFQWDDRNIIM